MKLLICVQLLSNYQRLKNILYFGVSYLTGWYAGQISIYRAFHNVLRDYKHL